MDDHGLKGAQVDGKMERWKDGKMAPELLFPPVSRPAPPRPKRPGIAEG